MKPGPRSLLTILIAAILVPIGAENQIAKRADWVSDPYVIAQCWILDDSQRYNSYVFFLIYIVSLMCKH